MTNQGEAVFNCEFNQGLITTNSLSIIEGIRNVVVMISVG